MKIVSRALPAVVNSLGVEEHAVLAPWDMCKAWWKMHVVVIVFVVGSPGLFYRECHSVGELCQLGCSQRFTGVRESCFVRPW